MAAPSIMNSRILAYYVGGTKVTYQVDAQIEFTASNRDVTNKDSSGHTQRLAGLRDFSGSFSALYVDDAAYGLRDFITAYNAGTVITIIYTTDVDGDQEFSCPVLITSITKSSPGTEENVTYDVAFEASDAPTVQDVSS